VIRLARTRLPSRPAPAPPDSSSRDRHWPATVVRQGQCIPRIDRASSRDCRRNPRTDRPRSRFQEARRLGCLAELARRGSRRLIRCWRYSSPRSRLAAPGNLPRRVCQRERPPFRRPRVPPRAPAHSRDRDRAPLLCAARRRRRSRASRLQPWPLAQPSIAMTARPRNPPPQRRRGLVRSPRRPTTHAAHSLHCRHIRPVIRRAVDGAVTSTVPLPVAQLVALPCSSPLALRIADPRADLSRTLDARAACVPRDEATDCNRRREQDDHAHSEPNPHATCRSIAISLRSKTVRRRKLRFGGGLVVPPRLSRVARARAHARKWQCAPHRPAIRQMLLGECERAGTRADR